MTDDDGIVPPEMQAIKAQLRYMARELATGCNDDANHGDFGKGWDDDAGERYWLSEHLSPEMIEWVLS